MLIRLFKEASAVRRDRFHTPVRMVVVNLGAVAGCAIFAVAWFAVAFAAGESDRPTPVGAMVFLWSMVLAVAALGILVSSTLKPLPWLAIFLTPLLLGLIMMTITGDHDGFSMGLRMGGITSVVFVLGALAVRGFVYWVRTRNPVSRV